MTGLAFWAALWLYLQFVNPLAPDYPPITTGFKIVTSAFVFWSVPKILDRGEYGGAQGNLFQMFCLSAGVVIIWQMVMLYAFHFEPEIVVQSRGAVFLHHKTMLGFLLEFGRRLRSFLEAPLAFVLFQCHRRT